MIQSMAKGNSTPKDIRHAHAITPHAKPGKSRARARETTPTPEHNIKRHGRAGGCLETHGDAADCAAPPQEVLSRPKRYGPQEGAILGMSAKAVNANLPHTCGARANPPAPRRPEPRLARQPPGRSSRADGPQLPPLCPTRRTSSRGEFTMHVQVHRDGGCGN